MRALLILVLPLLLQVLAYVAVFFASRGDVVLRPTVVGLAIALLPPIGLLIVRALES
jgi:hypothetical protein